MSTPTPRISIVMPVFNGAEHLQATLQSLLAQTFTDFELLIIDDGSTDATPALIEQAGDPRIRYLRNPENKGISYSANRGFAESRGKYMARADADDIHLPHRLASQWDFMEKNPHVAICGSFLQYIGEVQGSLQLPPDHDTIKAHLPFYTSLAQPSSFFRMDFVRKHQLNYDLSYIASGDYDLWCRVAYNMHGILANVQDILVQYRVHANSISNKKTQIQRDAAAKSCTRHLQEWGLSPSDNDIIAHAIVTRNPAQLPREVMELAYNWLRRLRAHNDTHPLYATEPWRAILAKRLLQLVSSNLHLGPWICKLLLTWPDVHMLGLSKQHMTALLEHAATQQRATPSHKRDT